MMKIEIINCLGESFVLSPNSAFAVTVSGLGPMGSTIVTKKFAKRGTKFINSTIDERNIVFTIKILADVERNREILSRMFIPGQTTQFVFETGLKKGNIKGYVENADIDWFTRQSKASPSVICPNPLFESDVLEVSGSEFTIDSKSVYDNDIFVNVTFENAQTEYVLQIGEEVLTITHDFVSGDQLYIDTEKRKVILNGIDNIYNDKSGTWVSLKYGENNIVSSAPATIVYTDKYISM